MGLEFITTDEMLLAAHWNSFCDDAPVPPGLASWDDFLTRMRRAKLAALRVEAGDEPAICRPIVWALTLAGQIAFDEAHNEEETDGAENRSEGNGAARGDGTPGAGG